MGPHIIFVILAGAAVIWYVVACLLIFDALRKRGEKVHFLFLNFLAPFYADRYRKVTKQETGKTGSLFFHWIIPINAALVFVIIAILIR